MRTSRQSLWVGVTIAVAGLLGTGVWGLVRILPCEDSISRDEAHSPLVVVDDITYSPLAPASAIDSPGAPTWGVVTGMVVDRNGMGVPKVVVIAESRSDRSELKTSTTAEDGSFTFEKLAAGTWHILLPAHLNRNLAIQPNGLATDIDVRPAHVLQGLRFVAAVYSDDFEVRGFGVASDGETASNASFYIVPKGAARNEGLEKSIPVYFWHRTPDGRWQYDVTIPGKVMTEPEEYDILVMKPGYRYQRFSLREFLQGPRVRLERGSAAINVVVSPWKIGISGHAYVHMNSNDPALWRTDYTRSAQLDEKGEALIEGLFPGVAEVEIRSSSAIISPKFQRVEVEASSVQAVEFVASSAPTALLQIPVDDSTPVGRVYVQVAGHPYPGDEGGIGGWHTPKIIPSDAGVFSVRLPEYRSYGLLIWGPALPLQYVTVNPRHPGVVLSVAETPMQRLNLQPVDPAWDLCDSILLPGNWDETTAWRVFADRDMTLTYPSEERTAVASRLPGVRIDHAGELVMPVPATIREFTLVSPSLGLHVVKAAEDGLIELDLAGLATVRGKVHVPEELDGSEVRVLVSEAVKSHPKSSITRVAMYGRLAQLESDGSFAIHYVRPGRYTLTPVVVNRESVQSVVPGYRIATKTIRVTGAGDFTIDLR